MKAKEAELSYDYSCPARLVAWRAALPCLWPVVGEERGWGAGVAGIRLARCPARDVTGGERGPISRAREGGGQEIEKQGAALLALSAQGYLHRPREEGRQAGAALPCPARGECSLTCERRTQPIIGGLPADRAIRGRAGSAEPCPGTTTVKAKEAELSNGAASQPGLWPGVLPCPACGLLQEKRGDGTQAQQASALHAALPRISHYNITDEIYNSLFISCTQWLHLKLQKAKETTTIPEVTKGYVQWIIAQKNGTSRLQFSLPWTIKCAGKNLEGIEFIQVKYQHAASLEKAISEKAKWYELYALPLGSLIAAGTIQPTAFCEVTFGVWALFSQEEQFTNHSSLKESLFQPMSTLGIDDKDEFDALTIAKSFFVRCAIKCICLKEDDKVVDIFSLGYGTKEALLQQRKVISVACTNEQMTELEALCHSTIDEDDELKRWAGLVSTPQNDNGKDSENEEIDEPLDAEADAILELLQETGQQDIAIEDVSCEVIGTEDVQAIETTEKDPLNPHLNQILHKDDDKETQAFEALQQNFTVNNVSCEVIDTKDAPAAEPINEESINPHLNQQACKEDDKEIQVSEGQPLQLLETKSNDTMEVDDDASSKTCRRTEEDSTKNILVAQDLSTRVHGDPNLLCNDGPMLTIILSLCGLLLRHCWQKSKKMKSLKFEHEYIVLRPGCIEFLKSLLSISNVGIWSAANDTQVMQIIKILEKEAKEQFPFFMIWGQSQCQQCVESRITRPDNPGVEAFFKRLAIASAKFEIDLKRLLLIDDAPLKGCINPALNCIFSS
ncbi:hypothetical protein L7F22_055342 [Adiantum nelumboides]|nr:hypothetical protein [Adiantum nelumboides]